MTLLSLRPIKGVDTWECSALLAGQGTSYYFQGDRPLNMPTEGMTVKFATTDSVLSLQLRYFTLSLADEGRYVHTSWGTSTEIHTAGFELQKSADARRNFTTVPKSFVHAHGTTDVPHDYAFIDSSASKGVWYYRIRQTDERGQARYTDALKVDLSTAKESAPYEFALFQNYPNPFNPETIIKFSVAVTGKTTLRLYNILGQQVATLFDDVAEVGEYYRVKLRGSDLATGVYFYSLQSGSRTDVKKLLLLK